ncbi:hypothetical protein DENSPDRAFT_779499 [Dentipellis sp. KUC8613]|nr:hypothetical protein DENSPDRAFT_779499 [Dentipellis sp. KUC8613]
MSSEAPDPKPSSKCQLVELLHYSCELRQEADGSRQFHCFPIPRILRICPGRPAVEITRFVNIDMTTGEVEIPPEASQVLPKGKVWRDVTRYKIEDEE